MKINKNNWQEFNFAKVFTISRGKRLVKIDQVMGDISYISSSKKNNGVDNYILPPSFMKIYKNALTLNNSGSVGYCFYHPYKFVASDHCTVIKIKDKKIKLNNYISLFLKPIIESMKSKYNFAREINNERLKKEKILLPATKNKLPDWEFMENYIKGLSKEIRYDSKIIKNKALKLKKNEFKEFDLSKLFNVRKTKKSFTRDEICSGEYLYITASNKNNGVVCTSDKYVENGNVITIDGATDGKAFYQENRFSSSGDPNILEPINFILNKYIALFFTSILNMQTFRYSFGRKRSRTRIMQEKIFLPVNKKGEPNFEFMENYIKSLSYSPCL
ncbi:MAG: restriction endonuclease subunit S [Parcubacteria group bacterium]|nr:restriction endonuclease subunit S [Parcubacteria group bacterium]